jgi:aromatic-L-amino-acid/L-tryptophan decarboxylase
MQNDDVSADPPPEEGPTLDPSDWTAFRAQAHRMLDDMLNYAENIGDRPVWQPIPDDVRSRFRSDLPQTSSDLAAVHQEFMSDILPFTTGNVHPGFMGWVHGGGTPVGMLAEMLAAGLNANLGGRDHVPIEVERQIVRWMQGLFGFTEGATGLFVTGTSLANFYRYPHCSRCRVGVSGAVRGCRRRFETTFGLHLAGGA